MTLSAVNIVNVMSVGDSVTESFNQLIHYKIKNVLP